MEGYRPGFIGRIVEMHGVFYAAEWGSGAHFEGLMACEMHSFMAAYDASGDLLLTAHVDGRLVGSAAVVGSEGVARLRWVLLEPGYHGLGIGKELVHRCLSFCRRAGFESVYLWTVEGLPASLSIYEKAGFKVVERVPDDTYGVPHMHLRLEIDLV